MASTDCPICLNSMDEADRTYPLLCPTECGYNFCMKCVEHLVDSSKADYEMASDGNRAVKIKLQCPQCRGDLSNTIKDTLLLRKAIVAMRYTLMPDSELNATELRTKHEFVQRYADDVRDAEARMRKFHKGGGATESLNITKSKDDEKEAYIDTNLFAGLEYAMTQEEQSFVTELMTSGNADQLAQAAQILHGIAQISLQGVTPSMRGAASTSKAPASSSRNTRSAFTSAGARSAERKKMEELEAQKKLHPLPARMPRYALMTAFDTAIKSKPLKFEDDEWDGSIADAFTRVHSGRARKNNPGIDNILSMAEDEHIAAPKERVKINLARGQAGRLGLQKGDVVTHINGERFLGNAEELNEVILSMYNENPSDPLTFALVVNAEASTAEVLRLRAKACKLATHENEEFEM